MEILILLSALLALGLLAGIVLTVFGLIFKLILLPLQFGFWMVKGLLGAAIALILLLLFLPLLGAALPVLLVIAAWPIALIALIILGIKALMGD